MELKESESDCICLWCMPVMWHKYNLHVTFTFCIVTLSLSLPLSLSDCLSLFSIVMFVLCFPLSPPFRYRAAFFSIFALFILFSFTLFIYYCINLQSLTFLSLLLCHKNKRITAYWHTYDHNFVWLYVRIFFLFISMGVNFL